MVTAVLVLLPGLALASDLVIPRYGPPYLVDRAQVLPDRVTIEGPGSAPIDLPRGDVTMVVPEANLPGVARPYAEQYGNITQQLTDQAHRDLQKSWALPSVRGR